MKSWHMWKRGSNKIAASEEKKKKPLGRPEQRKKSKPFQNPHVIIIKFLPHKKTVE